MLHRLSGDQAMRVNLLKQLLNPLEWQEVSEWHDGITVDESWLYFFTDSEIIWYAAGKIIHTSERVMICLTNE
jgi:hypothetical protein